MSLCNLQQIFHASFLLFCSNACTHKRLTIFDVQFEISQTYHLFFRPQISGLDNHEICQVDLLT